jgi:tRNA G18 (ribose-2'-O)-methylase SpoU
MSRLKISHKIPKGARLVGVELNIMQPIWAVEHPRRCVYLLGAEDNGFKKNIENVIIKI